LNPERITPHHSQKTAMGLIHLARPKAFFTSVQRITLDRANQKSQICRAKSRSTCALSSFPS
jgi:hypothetical protein